MAAYTRQDGNAMRRDAAARARQMQQRVPYQRMPHTAPHTPPPVLEETKFQELPESHSAPTPQNGNGRPAFLPGIDHLLEQIDGDRMLILALLAMLYKDGSNKKLMMALAYLLT